MVEWLVAHCRQNGLKRIWLETNRNWTGVVAFYLNWCFSVFREVPDDVYLEKAI